MLDLHGYFWGKAMHRPIEVRFKSNAIIIDMSQSLFLFSDHFIGSKSILIHGNHFFKADSEGENLEATTIGEGGARPVHKLSEAACLVQNFWTGLQVEVIGIGQ